METLPKISKYTLGENIDKVFIAFLELLFQASSAKGKLDILQKASDKLNLLKFLLRIAWESKTLDNKKYIKLSEKLNEIGKMLGGWIRYIQK